VHGEIDRDRAAGARPVVDDHLLAQLLSDLVEHDAGDDIGHSRGGERDDDADRPGRIIQRARRAERNEQQCRGQQRTGKQPYPRAHGILRGDV
jgi:hypothetical protein